MLQPDIDLHIRNDSPETGSTLPGGARVVGVFYAPELMEYQSTDFSVHPGVLNEVNFDGGLQGMLTKVRQNHPCHRIDVSILREQFQSGVPESFSTHSIGIHPDGYAEGFYVYSTDEPTVFYTDKEGNNPVQAQPGELVFVPGSCWHSSPSPGHDGTRVRIKFIP